MDQASATVIPRTAHEIGLTPDSLVKSCEGDLLLPDRVELGAPAEVPLKSGILNPAPKGEMHLEEGLVEFLPLTRREEEDLAATVLEGLLRETRVEVLMMYNPLSAWFLLL